MVRFRWEKFVLWLLLAAVAAVGVGQLAAWLGGYLRPVLVFPLFVGSLLGGMLVFLIRLLDLAHRGSVLVGVLVASVVCAGSEHWGCYLQAHREYERIAADWQAQTQGLTALSPQFAQAVQQQLPRPPGTFGEYLRRQVQEGRQIGPWIIQGGWVWASWWLEAGLTFAAALALLGATMRWPYCSRCESWYRMVRQGRLFPKDLARWAPLFEIELPAMGKNVRFRLLECLGRCSAGRLELVWEDSDGQLQSRQLELDAAQREKLDALWQAAASEESSPPETASSQDLPKE